MPAEKATRRPTRRCPGIQCPGAFARCTGASAARIAKTPFLRSGFLRGGIVARRHFSVFVRCRRFVPVVCGKDGRHNANWLVSTPLSAEDSAVQYRNTNRRYHLFDSTTSSRRLLFCACVCGCRTHARTPVCPIGAAACWPVGAVQLHTQARNVASAICPF